MKNTRLVRCPYFPVPRLQPCGGAQGRPELVDGQRGGRLDGETITRERTPIAVKTAMEERPCQ